MAIKELIELYDVPPEDDSGTETSTTRVSSTPAQSWKGKGKAKGTVSTKPLVDSSRSAASSAVTLNSDPMKSGINFYEDQTVSETLHLLESKDSERIYLERGGLFLKHDVQSQNCATVPHTPVPATTIFAYDAAPLHLPDLDSYLSRLPAPSFTPYLTGVRVGKKVTGQGMFPPMDHLAATKRSIADLEHNSKIAPSWRNRNSILGGLVNLALGVTVSVGKLMLILLNNLF